MINVGVDAWDFTPVALDHVVSLMNDEGESSE
jgi:calcineurin-like phosphoesterase family protein